MSLVSAQPLTKIIISNIFSGLKMGSV